MIVLPLTLMIVYFAAISCRPSLYDEPNPTTDLNQYKYRFDSSSTMITATDVTFNITVNESNGNSQIDHDLTMQDIQSIINESSDQYLDKLLINKHIGHKLEFDPIQQIPSDDYKLIVNIHILLYYDIIPNDEQEPINTDDLQHVIQLHSDNIFGKDTLHINVLHNNNNMKTTQQYYSSTEKLKSDDVFNEDHHKHHLSILLICVIILSLSICIFCVGFIIIIWYLYRIRNDQKQTQMKKEYNDKQINSFISVNGLHSNSAFVDGDVNEEDTENQNLVQKEAIHFKLENDMSDSDKLYDFDIPGMVTDDNTKQDVDGEAGDTNCGNVDTYDGKDVTVTPQEGINDTVVGK